MDFTAGLALAKGEFFIWFLILVILVIGICWQHYPKAMKDIIYAPEQVKKDSEKE